MLTPLNGKISNYSKSQAVPVFCTPVKALFVFLVFMGFFIFFNIITTKSTEAAEIGDVSVTINKGIISVSGNLILDDTQINDLKNGLQKELIFYVDLFRQWDIWPDEFIKGLKIIRRLKSDPVKNEFIMVSSIKGSTTEHRFNTLESLLSEALKFNNVLLSSTGDLLPGNYFVKVTAVSRIRKLAPLIGYLLFFVPEKEFTVEKNSDIFVLPAK
ncbi:hypothetical protein BMS3Abin07_01428 [bacterium BMS3Abin07]|nr:hypothetical protein BMS3Abin07_01428 [bacterium BMS3Abin07]GBE33100.1 hypothetical protein BMS3Bbin05_02037 [bacterium BMS3Bbin05]HDO21802.1 DUF4390 domain-containing protein [Nitrospirota bacterium]HDZ88770.1 DUF4390 domain-containing protein [Nitrospirota bacterium]